MYPGILGTVSEGTQTSDSTSWTLTYPAGVQSGELLLLLAATDGDQGTPTFPAGWTGGENQAAGSAASTVFAKKLAIGNESGNFTLTLTNSEQGCWKVFRVGPWEGTLGTNLNQDANGGSCIAGSFFASTSTTVSQGPMTPFNWGTEVCDNLWILVCAVDGGDTTFSGPPTNYTLIGTAQSSGGATGAALLACFRQRTISTEDPDSFTISPSEDFVVYTICIRPDYNVTSPGHGVRAQAEAASRYFVNDRRT